MSCDNTKNVLELLCKECWGSPKSHIKTAGVRNAKPAKTNMSTLDFLPTFEFTCIAPSREFSNRGAPAAQRAAKQSPITPIGKKQIFSLLHSLQCRHSLGSSRNLPPPRTSAGVVMYTLKGLINMYAQNFHYRYFVPVKHFNWALLYQVDHSWDSLLAKVSWFVRC